jgi:excisionase family DNA binding protein
MQVPVSTQQAALLLGVHESSVRRWCDAGRLSCERTPGGHRRIALDNLLAFALDEEVPCRLLDLRPYESMVWQAVQGGSRVDFAGLVGLAYGWLGAHESTLFDALIDFLVGMGIPLHGLFDRLLAPLAGRVGQAWHEGKVTVGEEHRMTEVVRDNLYRLLLAGRREGGGRTGAEPQAIVGCSRSEGHELGALMVRILLERAGWDVVYLGRQVPPEDLALERSRHRARLVCVSIGGAGALAEALQLVRVLDSMYDPEPSFHLVLGGGMLKQTARNESRLASDTFAVHVAPDLSTFVRLLDQLRA